MSTPSTLFSDYRDSFVRGQDEEMGLDDFLKYCKNDRMAYASAHECVLEAIGKPRLVNTAEDPRLSRIFQNRAIQLWDTFSEFHGMEETLMSLYAYFLHAAQGLEERLTRSVWPCPPRLSFRDLKSWRRHHRTPRTERRG